MKYRFIPMLIASLILLTSMSECKDGDVLFINHTEYSPINAEIDGVLYTSGDYTYLNWGGSPFELSKKENEFSFSFYRDIHSENHGVYISISFSKSEPFELNKKYDLGEGCGKIYYFRDGNERVSYPMIEGHIIFTECTGNEENYYIVSGTFEFTAKDSGNDRIVKVTNGTFENLWT